MSGFFSRLSERASTWFAKRLRAPTHVAVFVSSRPNENHYRYFVGSQERLKNMQPVGFERISVKRIPALFKPAILDYLRRVSIRGPAGLLGDSVYTKQGALAIPRYVAPKSWGKGLLVGLDEYRFSKSTKGLGAYLESISLTHLERSGIRRLRSSELTKDALRRLYRRAGIDADQDYDIRDWRRRIAGTLRERIRQASDTRSLPAFLL